MAERRMISSAAKGAVVAFWLALLCLGSSSRAEMQVDAINPTATKGTLGADNQYPSGVAEIGWPFTPAKSYYLVGVQSFFASTDSRTVTLEIWSGIPSSGGTLLRSAPFIGPLMVTTQGTLLEANFPQLLIQAGTTYFIGIKNVAGYGINLTDDAGATQLKPFYFGADPGQNYPSALSEDYASSPIFLFFGPDVSGPLPVQTQKVFAPGDPVPGAGTHGIPGDAVFSSFGPPAVGGGSVAFVGHWTSPTQHGALARGTDLFVAGALVAEVGGPVEAVGAPFGANYAAFRDPVMDSDGHVAFIATISGHAFTGANNSVIVSNLGSQGLAVMAQTGQPSAEAGNTGFNYRKFVSVALPGGRGPLFDANLIGPHSKPGEAVFCVDGLGVPRRLFGLGDPIGNSKLKSYSFLKAVPGSIGAARAYDTSGNGKVTWLANLMNGTSQVMTTVVP
jgi:hypothetical protein